MVKQIKKKLLFTPGPLTTSDFTKKSMLIDLGSRDREFIRINKLLFFDILKLTHIKSGYVCLPIQGSGTFGLEATLSTLLNYKSKILILSNGVYGNRIIDICKRIGKKFLILRFNEDSLININKIKETIAKNKAISHIALVHCETSSGILNPLKEISLICKKYKKN